MTAEDSTLPKPKMGRPRKELDTAKFLELVGNGLSHEDALSTLGMSRRTLYRRKAEAGIETTKQYKTSERIKAALPLAAEALAAKETLTAAAKKVGVARNTLSMNGLRSQYSRGQRPAPKPGG